MNAKKKALVLGGTNPHIELIKNLKNRGFYTILIDYFKNPPARTYADEHIQASTLDNEAVLKIAQDNKVDLVISTCVDQANATACFVAEKLNLPKPYSYETALKVTNKPIMKEIMRDSGIPTSDFIYASSVDDFDESKLDYPVVVKPADCNGSKGVRKVDNDNDLKKYLQEALSLSRTNNAIIEEYVEGDEIQIDCFIQDNKAKLLMMSKKRKMPARMDSVMQSFGSIMPYTVSETVRAKIQKIVEKIAVSFKLNNTPMLIQTLVHNDDVSVIEFAPRIGGGLSYRIIKMVSSFDILNASVDSFLGNMVDVETKNSNCCFSTNNIYARPCVFKEITGYQQLIEQSVIEEFYPYKTQGMTVGAEVSSSNRIAGFLVKAQNHNELIKKMKIAVNKLEVVDMSNNSVMIKDFYFDEFGS